ncbi:MAG: sulfatase-like hydrolase/transferase, partial [Lentisphaeraceae bacterium]|nr:sulfatase-like hydrolase/transferase [Lentisphaeraceae bacterium]
MNFKKILVAMTLAFCCLSIEAEETKKPNIIFILADDLGYADVGFNGQKKIKTPHLDQMAKEGMIFSDFYSGSAVCGPSRATLMSGHHTGHCKIRANPRWMVSDKVIDFDETDQTLGKVIKSAGYTCGYFGKWGLNENVSEGTGHPLKQGFDEFWGFNTHKEAHYHWPAYVWHNNEKVVLATGNDNWENKKVYADDLFTNKAVDFIKNNAGKKPFFAFLAYTIPHLGVSAPKESWKQYENLGWKKKKGKVAHYRDDPDINISYAAMISHMDAYVGQLKEALKAKGELDNTLIFFTSDNGHYKSAFFESGGEFKGGKTWLWEGCIRMPTVVSWPGKIKAGTTLNKPFALW